MKKYHKTKGACLLLDEPQLYCNIRALNEGTQVESSIDGTYVYPDDIYPAAKKNLRHLQRQAAVSGKEPPTLISLAAYRESWEIVKENTYSQGHHIGIYKAAAQHPLLGCIFHQKSEISDLPGYCLRQKCTGTNAVFT